MLPQLWLRLQSRIAMAFAQRDCKSFNTWKSCASSLRARWALSAGGWAQAKRDQAKGAGVLSIGWKGVGCIHSFTHSSILPPSFTHLPFFCPLLCSIHPPIHPSIYSPTHLPSTHSSASSPTCALTCSSVCPPSSILWAQRSFYAPRALLSAGDLEIMNKAPAVVDQTVYWGRPTIKQRNEMVWKPDKHFEESSERAMLARVVREGLSEEVTLELSFEECEGERKWHKEFSRLREWLHEEGKGSCLRNN